MEALEAWYGLPEEVKFCKRCIMSNQRPVSNREFLHTREYNHTPLAFDDEGICAACRYHEAKRAMDWEAREQELTLLLDKHRKKNGAYDVIVPGSGGKDSMYAAHILKHKYGMHPITVTWPPLLYTDVGWKNFQAWTRLFENITFKPAGHIHALLTRLAIENLLHPFQPFMLGQKNLAPRLAVQLGVPLVMYGESEVEYGNPVAESRSSVMMEFYYSHFRPDLAAIAGLPIQQLISQHGLSLADLAPYLPLDPNVLGEEDIQVHYLGYYLRWTPQENYYYAVEHCGFQANDERSEGTYTKANSLDDKIDGLHYYTGYIKFGFGRAVREASQEIYNSHITREEGLALARRFDGEFPIKYFWDVMDYIGMDPQSFVDLCEKFRSPHLWWYDETAPASSKRSGSAWHLRHPVE